MSPEREWPTLEGMEISILRWTIASFLGGVCVLCLASVPLVAYCAGADSTALRHAVYATVVIAFVCALVIVVALDLLGARARRDVPGRRPVHARRVRLSR